MTRQRQAAPAPAPADSPFRDQEEAAAYLRLAPSTLERYRVAGTGPRYSKHGDRVVYHVDRLNEWSKARERVSTTDAPASTDGGSRRDDRGPLI